MSNLHDYPFNFVQPSNSEKGFSVDEHAGREIREKFLAACGRIYPDSILQKKLCPLTISVLVELPGKHNEFVEPFYYGRLFREKEAKIFQRFISSDPFEHFVQDDEFVKPILTLGAYDLDKPQKTPIDSDARFRFWDSSIWHRYINHKSSKFDQELRDILIEFSAYYEQGLYESLNSCESLEFQCRKLFHSFVVGGDHGKSVRPFNFHSEKEMADLTHKYWKKIYKAGFVWRALLIDDKAEHKLASRNQGEQIDLTKQKLLDNILNWGGKNFIHIHKEDRLESLPNKVEGEGKMVHTDLVFLDLKLGESPYEGHEGVKFLENLAEWNRGHKLSDHAPFHRFWVFPITAFVDGFHSYKAIKGIDSFNEHFYLSDGADPFTTPHLFRYRLARILHHQIQQLGEPIFGLLQEISQNEMIKRIAREAYPKLLDKHALFLRLDKIKKERGGTPIHPNMESQDFIDSALKNHFLCTDELFWLHLVKLVYLLGFESWEEKGHQLEEKISLLLRILEKKRHIDAKVLQQPLKTIRDRLI